jgi:hypothetical protein
MDRSRKLQYCVDQLCEVRTQTGDMKCLVAVPAYTLTEVKKKSKAVPLHAM